METDYQFKRILLNTELVDLKQLIGNATEFLEHYPNFKKWLEHASEEILIGDRLAYGMFKPVTINGQLKSALIGITIIKITEHFAELKSLYLKEEYRHKEQNYGDILYNKTEKQLLKRGITKIITDVPHRNQETTSFLIKHGFQIDGLIERYKKGDLNYILSKDVTPDYPGDPFDWCHLVDWVLKNIYHFDIYEYEIINKETRSFSFNLTPNPNCISDYKLVKGVCLVYEGIVDSANSDEICNCAQTKRATICSIAAMKFEGDAGDKCRDNRILFLDEERIYSLSGCNKSVFEKNDISGMIIEIRYKFFKDISDNLNGSHDSFVYFKGPGIGKYSGNGDILLFFVDSCDQHPNGAIMGVGKVKECSFDTPERQWEKYNRMNPIFSKEDFDRYAKYKHKVVAYVVEDFKIISPIEHHDIMTILKNQIKVDDVEHHYLNDPLMDMFLDKIDSEILNDKKENDDAKKLIKGTHF